eukprot:g5228.t1
MCIEHCASMAVVLECTPGIVSIFLRGLAKLSIDGDSQGNEEDINVAAMYKKGRVVLNMDCVEERHFSSFLCVDVSSEKESSINIDEEFGGQTVLASIDLYKRLRDANENLCHEEQATKVDGEGKMQSKHLISNERIVTFANADDFFTIAEHLGFYETPLATFLDSEKTWPLE